MIGFTFKHLKPFALFLSIVVLFQCCMVYDKQPVTVEEAISIDHKKIKRIKIDIIDNKTIVFDSIYYKDDQLYGLKIKPKEKIRYNVVTEQFPKGYTDTIKKIIEIQINENEIIKIRLHNRRKTTTLNSFIALLSVCAIFVGYFWIAFAIEAKNTK